MKNILNPVFKILFTILICFSISQSGLAQQCASDSLLTYPAGDINYLDPGFADPNMLPCLSSGVYSELVIPFKTYNQGARLLTLADSTTVPISRIYGVQIENVANLPSGLCWAVKPSTATIAGDQVGAIIIKGTTSVGVGTYPISVRLRLDTKGDGTYTYTGLDAFNYGALLGRVIVKVSGDGNNCPEVNY